MATKPTTTPEAEAATPTMSLADFCSRLSEKVKRPELIGGFHHSEQAAGRTVDSSTAYRARYDEFVNKPV